MAKMYCQWVGIILIVLGVIGLFAGSNLLGVDVTGLHTWIHLITGVILAYLGFTGTSVKTGAQVFGVVYTLVAILGFIGGSTVPVVGINTNMLYNLIHLVVGVLGLYAGFAKGAEPAKA
jgi:hypothetical protein